MAGEQERPLQALRERADERAVDAVAQVTYLFTDIEGSTRRWEGDPERMSLDLSRHFDLIGTAVQRHRGTVVQDTGDGVFAAFPNARDAVAAAVDAQRGLREADWGPQGELRVRMGLHTGMADAGTRQYRGTSVNRCARVMDAAHGGQILVSEATWAVVREASPDGVSLVDLGEHRLKDIGQPERLFQVRTSDLPTEFPPLRTRRDAVVACPYKGLASFQPEDADWFFGRDAMVDQLVGMLTSSSFLGVIGPSGSGKSSLVRAGLVPRLQGGALPGSDTWTTVLFTPGAHPLDELADRAGRLTGMDAGQVRELIVDGRVDRIVDQALAGQDRHGRLVLVVDQFEELFSLCDDPEERSAFIDALLRLSTRIDTRASVVIVLRADYYGRCAEHVGLARQLTQSQVLVGPMGRDELRSAIVQPAVSAGLRIEDDLVEEIVDVAAGEAGGLPLVSHALVETWTRREGDTLTLRGYRDAGGVEGAIARTAERLYRDGLDRLEQTIARRLLLRLVEPTVDAQDTRRPAQLSELRFPDVPDRLVTDVLDELVRARLVIVAEDTAELAHEALIREWPTLRSWLDDDRDVLRAHRHLTQAVRAWEEQGRDRAELYRGTRLAAALELVDGGQLAPSEDERAFLDDSLAARDEQEAAERDRLARERDLERRASRRLRIIAAVTTVAALAAVVLTALAFQQRDRAREQREVAQRQTRIAKARELAAAADAQLGVDQQLSVLLAREAVRTTFDVDGTALPEAESALHRAIVASRLVTQVSGVGGHLAISPDGELFVTEGPEDTGIIDVRDVASGTSVHSFRGHERSIGDRPPDLNAVAFSPDGQLLATAGDDGTLRIWERTWETRDDTELHVISGGQLGAVWGPSFSPDGTQVAAAWLNEGVVRVVDLSTGSVTLEVEGLAFPYGAAFDTTGARLAVPIAAEGIAVVLDAATGERLFELPDAGGRAVAWSPDGRFLVTSGLETASARVWDAADGSLRTTLFGHTAPVTSAAWAPGSDRLATGSIDGTARIWRLAVGGAEQELELGTAARGVQGLAFTPDGERLLAGEEGSEEAITVRVWDLTSNGTAEVANLPGASVGPTMVASGDGRDEVVVTSTDGSVIVRDLATDTTTLRIELGTDGLPVADLEPSPDGELLGVAVGAEVHLFEARTGQRTARVPLGSPVSVVAWHPDNDRLAVGEVSGNVSIVDDAGQVVAVLEASAASRPPDWSAFAVAFSPDGSVLAVGGGGGGRPDSWHVELWDADRMQVVDVLDPGQFTGDVLAFAPDGQVLLVAGFGGAVIFDLETRERLSSLVGHGAGGVTAAQFAPSGSELATAGRDGSIRLWDAQSFDEVLVLPGHTGEVASVAFSPDGTRLVSGGVARPGGATSLEPAQAKVWALDLHELLEIADREVSRELTPAECGRYLGQDC